ncbi:MAG: phospholipase/carboxylesterase [Alphaproteobacteria bacterium]|jgi:phospholipase/carboxylesterase|nr:phospholipase/carboxylesterase [Alphaproteobacteria bacterium]
MSTAQPDLGLIHRFVPGTDASRATLLLLHGSGGDEHDLVPLAEQIAPGRALLSPRGQVNQQGITRFFRRAPDGAWDLDDFEQRTGELADFLRKARGAYGLPKPMVLGYSNGANIGWSLLLREPGALAGAILLRGMAPFDPRPLPDLSGIPVLLIAAHDDDLIPVERAGLLAALLGEAGADVTYEVLRSGHGLTGEDLKLASEWLAARR